MRRCLLSLAAVAWLSICSHQAAAQTGLPPAIGVIGNNVEMYLGTTCGGVTLCGLSFPVNNTGKVIRITSIACGIEVDNSANLIAVYFGPTAAANSYTLPIKSTPPTSWTRIDNGSIDTFLVSAEPNMFLGAGRYLTVSLRSSGGDMFARCQAAGVFAQ